MTKQVDVRLPEWLDGSAEPMIWVPLEVVARALEKSVLLYKELQPDAERGETWAEFYRLSDAMVDAIRDPAKAEYAE